MYVGDRIPTALPPPEETMFFVSRRMISLVSLLMVAIVGVEFWMVVMVVSGV